MALLPFLLKGLLAGVIVGFVTASIQSWVDRFFLVILLVGLLHVPIKEAILVNLIVVGLAALMMVVRQSDILIDVHTSWSLIILPAVMGSITGRILAQNLSASMLLLVLGAYAILVGVRLVLIKPLPEREDKAHSAWFVPIAAFSGFLVGLISAGGKPFTIPLYNAALGHHPRQAYALAALGVVSGAWAALASQVALGHAIPQQDLLLAIYLFSVIVLTALAVHRFWSQKLNRIVVWTVAPLLVLVGVRFMVMAMAMA